LFGFTPFIQSVLWMQTSWLHISVHVLTRALLYHAHTVHSPMLQHVRALLSLIVEMTYRARICHVM